jgi:hypothetical protein
VDFFEPAFLAELEELAKGQPASPAAPDVSALQEKLSAFLAPDPASGSPEPLNEDTFAALSPASVASRTNELVEMCRAGGRGAASLAVENFVVFFQALVPTLSEEGQRQIKRLFFRLVPTLIQIAGRDFGDSEDRRAEGVAALRNLETILIEISSVRLAPTEGELVFRSIDQMTGFIAAGEYTMANEVISSQLLGIITRNKLSRALFRLMEVEVSIQQHLQERLGYSTPLIRLPQDEQPLSDYGAIRLFHETSLDGERERYIQVQIPDLPILRDVVVRLVDQRTGAEHDVRLDGLGSARLDVPDGAYRLGLVYAPEGGR